MKKLFLAIVIVAFSVANSFGSGYDFAALFNPKNYANVDTVYRNAYGKQVFVIAFEKMNVAMGKSAFNIKIPQKIVIKNLSLGVHAKNLTRDELDKTNFPRPLDFEIDGLLVTIYGKKNNILTIKAARARVYRENVIYLSADSELSVGDKNVKLGNGATITLKDRTLIVNSPELGKVGIKI